MRCQRTPIWPVIVACVASVLILPFLSSVYRDGFDKPFDYQNDSLSTLTAIKGILETGWVGSNPSLGAPNGQDQRALPLPDVSTFALIKAAGWIRRDVAFDMNLIYIVSFPLVAGFAAFVALRLKLRPATAAAAGVLYAFTPYHFMRLEHHIALSLYYSVPLAVLIGHDLATGRAEIGRASWRQAAGYAAAAIACGINGIYYGAMSAVLIAISGLAGSARGRKPMRAASAVAYAAIVVAALGLCCAPFLLSPTRESYAKTVIREPSETERYALVISDMVLPIPDHRLVPLRELQLRFDRSMVTALSNENRTAALGMIGTFGLLILLLAPLARPVRVIVRRHPALSVIVYASIFWATVGGVSAFATVLGPSGMLRSMNRISIFIAFCCFCAAGLAYDRFTSRWARWTAPAALAAIVLLASFEQSTFSFAAPNPFTARWNSDCRFGAMIDSILPAGAMIYEMPYIPYPEGTETALGDYDEFRPYLHTHHVRYSYGAVRGTGADDWQQMLPHDGAGLVDVLRQRGFRAILIDQNYIQGGAAAAIVERNLADICHSDPIISDDGSFVFIPIRAAAQPGPTP